MFVDIYQSNIKLSKYIFVKTGIDIKNLNIPDTDFSSVKPFKNNVDFQFEENRIAIKSDDVINGITLNGYFIAP